MLPQKLRNVSSAFHFVTEFTETASRAFGSHFQHISLMSKRKRINRRDALTAVSPEEL